MFGIENILVIYISALAAINGDLTPGMLYAFLAYKTRFVSSMNGLIDQWIEFKMLDLHLSRLADIVHTKAELPSTQAEQGVESDANKVVGKIEVRNLCFRYSEHEPYIIDNLNFVIEARESVALLLNVFNTLFMAVLARGIKQELADSK